MNCIFTMEALGNKYRLKSMRRILLIIIIFLPIMMFSQGNVKLLRVNGVSPYYDFGNFSFSGDAMFINGIQTLHKLGDTLYIDLHAIFSEGLRPGYTTIEEEGTIRFDGSDMQVYVDGSWTSMTSKVYEEELTTNKTIFSLGFKLESSSMVYFNGQVVKSDLWSGVGTTTLTLSLDTRQYDHIYVKQ